MASSFAAGNVNVANGAVTALADGGAGTDFTFGIQPDDQELEITVQVAENVITDLAGNLNTESNELTFVFDTVAPTVTVTTSHALITRQAPIEVTFTFSEAVVPIEVGDFADGVDVVAGALSNLVAVDTADGPANDATFPQTFTADLTPSAEGTVSVKVCPTLLTLTLTRAQTHSFVSWRVLLRNITKP